MGDLVVLKDMQDLSSSIVAQLPRFNNRRPRWPHRPRARLDRHQK